MILKFEPENFKINYPQFATLDNTYLTQSFNYEAVILGTKVIASVTGNDDKLYWAQVVLAHILTLSAKEIGSGQTGRLSQASEGDVSGSFEYITNEDNSWWAQTTYGQKCFKLLQLTGGFIYFAPPEDNIYPWV